MGGHLMCQFQNSYGTTLATSLHAVPIVSENFVETIEQLTEANMKARFGEGDYHEGGHSIGGTVSLEAEPTAMGHFLKSVLGTVSTTSGSGIQTHVFLPSIPASEYDCRAANQPMYFEVYRDVGSAFVYYDCIGNDLSINIANGQLVTMDTSFIGAGFTRVAKSTPTFPTGKPFLWDQFSGSYNGADIVDLRDLTVSINNNLEARYTLTNTKSPYRIKRTGPQVIELSGTMTFAAHSYQQAFEDQVEKSFKVFFANADAPHTFHMEFSKLRFKTFETTMAGPGLIESTFTAGAMFDTSSNTAGTFTLVNTQTYY